MTIFRTIKFIMILFIISVSHSAYAGSDNGYLNLKMNDHKIAGNKNNKKQLISTIMQKLGNYDNKLKCHIVTVQPLKFCLNPVDLFVAGVVDSDFSILALTGTETSGQYQTGVFMTISYASSFYTKGLQFSSINGFYAAGSRQQAVDKNNIKLIEISPESYAWELRDGYTGQGETVERTVLVFETGIADIPQKKILDFVSYEDNGGICDAAQKIKCEMKKITYKILQSDKGDMKAGDLELTYTYKVDNKTAGTSKHIVKFNEKDNVYALPSKDMLKFMDDKISKPASVNTAPPPQKIKSSIPANPSISTTSALQKCPPQHPFNNCYGNATFKEGATYMGEFQNDKPNGTGVFIDKDGRKFSGQFNNGNIEGYQLVVFPDGMVIEGQYQNNKILSGTQYWSDGRRYTGGYENGRFSGYGVMIFPDKRIHIGIWKDGKPSGNGTQYSSNRVMTLNGLWEDGNLKTSAAEKIYDISKADELIDTK